MNPISLPDRPLRFLHLGDSYTIGEGIPKELSWPVQLKTILGSKDLDVKEQRVLAKTGWTTRDLLNALKAAEMQSSWDLITLCIGVNNQYQGRSLEEFGSEIAELIDQALLLLPDQNGHLMVLSIPDWSASPFARDRDRSSIGNEIGRFNKEVERIACIKHVSMVGWTELTQQFIDNDEAFAEDGLHPSGIQYAHWANYLVPYIGSN